MVAAGRDLFGNIWWRGTWKYIGAESIINFTQDLFLISLITKASNLHTPSSITLMHIDLLGFTILIIEFVFFKKLKLPV